MTKLCSFQQQHPEPNLKDSSMGSTVLFLQKKRGLQQKLRNCNINSTRSILSGIFKKCHLTEQMKHINFYPRPVTNLQLPPCTDCVYTGHPLMVGCSYRYISQLVYTIALFCCIQSFHPQQFSLFKATHSN